jgi:FkbM family methyltransferase
MRLKDFFYMLGFKPKGKKYGHTQVTYQLPDDGTVDFAYWEHPRFDGFKIEQDHISALRKFLKPGDVAIDIGAHCGDTTVPMALAVGKEGYVFAFEPNPYVFDTLDANSKLNQEKSNIEAIQYAASDKPQEMVFEYSDPDFVNGGRHEGISRWKHGHAFELRVQSVNVTDYLNENFPDTLNKLKFIKVDTEGYDLYVLKSMIGLLEEQLPFLRIEIFKHTSQEYRDELYDLLKGLNYSIHKFESPSQYQGQQLNKEDMQNWKHFDIFCYC